MRTISALLVLQLFLTKNVKLLLRTDVSVSEGERNLHQSHSHERIEQENGSAAPAVENMQLLP